MLGTSNVIKNSECTTIVQVVNVEVRLSHVVEWFTNVRDCSKINQGTSCLAYES